MSEEPSDYLLFVVQNANFEPRSMLLPAKEFLELHQESWNQMREACANATFENLFVDHLLWKDVTDWETHSQECWSLMASYLEEVYDWGTEASHDPADNAWIKKSLYKICQGFNVVKEYCKAQKLSSWKGQPIRIIDSILILEKRASKHWSPPAFETVQDLQKFYIFRETNKRINL